MKTILLSTAYFAPVQYYSKLAQKGASVIIEKHEHYQKQSYRNRCTVYSANGLLDLTVPVVKTAASGTPVSLVKIAYDTPWQKLHFKSVESAYRRSPFYEYYIDDLLIFFRHRHEYLYEFNMQIMKVICSLIGIKPDLRESGKYMTPDSGTVDLRTGIHPKKIRQLSDSDFHPQPYIQVFSDKYGFKPNLSILDLLFNTGPDAKQLLTVP